MKLQQAPQPVLAKLLALDEHAEALTADADDAASRLEYNRAVLGGRIEDSRVDLKATHTEFERLLQEVPRARARADAEQRVLSNCKLWLDQLAFNTKLLYEPAVVADGQDLGSVRGQLATAEREINALRSAPIAAADIEQRVATYVEGLSRAGAPLVRGFAPAEQLQVWWPESPAGGNRMNSQGFNPQTANPLLLAARLLPQQLAQSILSEVAELTRGQDERPARIAELEQQVAQLRRLEEALVSRALAADEPVARDPAAPPEAILEVRLRPAVHPSLNQTLEAGIEDHDFGVGPALRSGPPPLPVKSVSDRT